MALHRELDWDEGNIKHLARHAVTPAEFEQVMQRDPVLFGYDNVDGEDRWTGLGETENLRVLLIAFTIREGRIRAVTAYQASRKKAREYWQRKGN